MWAPFSKSFNYDWLQLLPVRWTPPVVRGTFINCCFSKDGLQSCTHDLFNICPPHWCCYIPAMIPYWSLSITIHGYAKWHDILFKDNYLHCALQSLLEKLFIKKKKMFLLSSTTARIDIVCRSPEFIHANEMPTHWIKILKNETEYRCSFWQETFKSFWLQGSVLECFCMAAKHFQRRASHLGKVLKRTNTNNL